MGPSFNENFTELDNLWVPWIVHVTHWQRHKCAEINPNSTLVAYSLKKQIKKNFFFIVGLNKILSNIIKLQIPKINPLDSNIIKLRIHKINPLDYESDNTHWNHNSHK